MSGEADVPEAHVRRERVGVGVGLTIVALTIALTVGGTWLWVSNAHTDCEHIVQGRQNARTMFEYLAGSAPDQTDPRVVAFRNELDRRLPHLECVGWFDTRAVPVKED